jgi:hypothetical protein
VVLAVLGERQLNGTVTNSRVALRKLRSGETGSEFPFRSRVVDLGPDKYGKPVTTLMIDWTAVQAGTWTGASAKPDPQGLRQIRQVIMTILADKGVELTVVPDSPPVRAVDLEEVRAEFYKSYIPTAEGDEKKKQNARRQAFKRATDMALDREVVGARAADGKIWVWLKSANAAPQHGSSG